LKQLIFSFSSDNGGAEIKGKEIISDNAPLKYGKKHPEEGGVRVPMIVTGPENQRWQHLQ
jgi:arylsulfatase A-like enzyme